MIKFSSSLFKCFARIASVSIIVLWSALSNSQTLSQDYKFIPSIGAYVPLHISTGAAHASSLEPGTDDAIESGIPIGFTFEYRGMSYTHLTTSSNGYVSLSNSPGSSFNNDFYNSANMGLPAFALLWDDLVLGDSILYQTVGTVGSRVFTMEWKNMHWDLNAGMPIISFQLKLYEGSNNIEFQYTNHNTNVVSRSATVGITDTAAGSGYFLSLADLSSSPVVSATTSNNNLNLNPAEGQKYTFKALTTFNDSLALVALYNSTNGANWTNKTNWLSGNLNTWFGVTLDADRRVTELNLGYNQLSGSIPAELGNLSNLQTLDLDNNQLSGNIPLELGNLSNLGFLSLYLNQLSGSIPVELGNLSNLQYLYLSFNRLSGSIPLELGNLTNLQDLSLFNNQLSGSIPAELGNLTNLQELYLSGNQLSGSIPEEMGNLSNLQTLSLYSNQLSGSISASLGNMSNLQELYLEGNQLSGIIPSELGNLSKLQSLYLYSNQFSGSIPTELGNLTNLQYLSLSIYP